MLYYETIMRGRAVVAYQAHNLKVSGSIPLPATNEIQELTIRKFLFLRSNSGICNFLSEECFADFFYRRDPFPAAVSSR